MTDILVRVPAKETEHFWADHDGDVEFWRCGVYPTQFFSGDWIFFALGADVVAYASRAWSLRLSHGSRIYWPAKDFQRLARPIPLTEIGLQVPRGFAYCGHTKLRQLIIASETIADDDYVAAAVFALTAGQRTP